MNLTYILSSYPSIHRIIKEAIHSRKEVIKINKLMSLAGFVIVLVVLFSVLLGLFSSYAANQYVATFDHETIDTNIWHKLFTSNIYKHTYKFIYGAIGLAFVIQYYYRKPYELKLKQFQKLEQSSVREIMGMVYPTYTFKSTRYSTKEDKFEISKIFGWKGEQSMSCKIYGSLENTDDVIKTKIYDIGVIKHNVPSFLLYIPYIGFLFYYSDYAIHLLKNIFTQSTAEANLNDFRGLYAVSEFPKKLYGYTVVLPKSIESKLQHWDVKEQERVDLEDVRFTNEFLVYSTDQVEARYAISTAMMEKILAFRGKAKLPILIAFVDNTIHIAIENKDGVFSIPTAKTEALEVLEEITEEVEVTLDIVNDFSLNRKIFN